MKRLLKWPMLCGLSGLLLAQTVPAAQDYYINNGVVANALNIDATNFINNGSFTATSFTRYETTRTRNYTNNGSMIGYGGFQFDTLLSGGRTMASSFYNPGSISVFPGGQLIVNATNIVSPGVVDVGSSGGITLTGQNLDLSYGAFILEQGGIFDSAFGISGTVGAFGINTNQNWNPRNALTATTATSSPPYPYAFTLFNSQPYFSPPFQTSPSNQIIWVVFISNPYVNVTNNVYFVRDADDAGLGAARVEWIGTYPDAATGQMLTNYLYLANNYVLGASTNVTLYNGIPSNFTFTKGGPDRSLTNPVASGFGTNTFPAGSITNPYSYTLAQFDATSVPPGPSSLNPSGALTNLPGRTQITASRELNLALATIGGQNYLSLTCTNQFDGNDGASIFSPFSDINLGVTNGLLTVSNLLQSAIPAWVGTVQAWSTRWLNTDTNTGLTTDFRVLLVDSQILPNTSPKIQDLTLHSTNVIISDQLNILRKLSIDAKSLTLTTNGAGAGAGAVMGELNLESAGISFSSSLPNLRWLTNNGVISTLNGDTANFGSAPPNNYFALINRGFISNVGGTRVRANDFQNSGTFYCGDAGSFLLQSLTANIQGTIIAAADVSITSDSLIASNLYLPSGKSLTLTVTNLLTDGGPPANNDWVASGASLVGINLPIKPAAGDLLGTFISIFTSTTLNQNVLNTWAGQNRGTSTSGYSNNVAVGQLYLAPGKAAPFGKLTFTGTGSSNAIYVDQLILAGSATSGWGVSNIPSLNISPNMVIYYAEALSNGVSVAEKINHWNTNRLRWVSSYAGYFSSTNSGGVAVNAALAASTIIDSDGDGTPNASDPTPFFQSSQVNFAITLTNLPPVTAVLSWKSIPLANNLVYYRTNLTTASWTLLTNFVTSVSPPSAPVTVTALDPVNPAAPRYYQVRVDAVAP